MINLDEFQGLPRNDARHELDRGELITLPPAKSLHARIVSRVYRIIWQAAADHYYEVFAEAGYLLCADPPTVRQPDLSLLSKARVDRSPVDAYFEGAPELAVEVVSPTDAADVIEHKVRQYLQHGVLQVWVLYSKTRSVQVFRDSSAVIFDSDQTLDAGPVLEGFSTPVAQLFAV